MSRWIDVASRCNPSLSHRGGRSSGGARRPETDWRSRDVDGRSVRHTVSGTRWQTRRSLEWDSSVTMSWITAGQRRSAKFWCSKYSPTSVNIVTKCNTLEYDTHLCSAQGRVRIGGTSWQWTVLCTTWRQRTVRSLSGIWRKRVRQQTEDSFKRILHRGCSYRKVAWWKIWSDCWFWEQKSRWWLELSGRLIVWQQFEQVWR